MLPSSIIFIKDASPSEAIEGGPYKVNKTEVLKKKMKKEYYCQTFTIMI